MNFKVGDRVKIIADEDALGVLGQSGKISHQASDRVWVVDLGGSTVALFDHELQLIPMTIAGDIRVEPVGQEPSHEEHIQAHMEAERGLRHDAGKPEIHQVPPSLIIAVAEVLKYGEQKYAKGNWKKGMDWVKPYDCLMRHMFKWLAGEEEDEESGLSHLYHAAANIAMLIEYRESCPELDNREF